MCMPPVTRSGVPLPSRSPTASVTSGSARRLCAAWRTASARRSPARPGCAHPDRATGCKRSPRRHRDHRPRRRRPPAGSRRPTGPRSGAWNAGHPGSATTARRATAAVRRRVVERVPVAVQEVGEPVAVEIGHGDPARSEIGIGRPPDQLRVEAVAPVERPDLFPLLADERDHGRRVTVHVDDHGIDRSGQSLQHVRFRRSSRRGSPATGSPPWS